MSAFIEDHITCEAALGLREAVKTRACSKRYKEALAIYIEMACEYSPSTTLHDMTNGPRPTAVWFREGVTDLLVPGLYFAY